MAALFERDEPIVGFKNAAQVLDRYAPVVRGRIGSEENTRAPRRRVPAERGDRQDDAGVGLLRSKSVV